MDQERRNRVDLRVKLEERLVYEQRCDIISCAAASFSSKTRNVVVLASRIGCFSAPQSIFCKPGALLSFFQLLLGLPELGQVEGSDLLGLLDLLFVGLDLLLQLAG